MAHGFRLPGNLTDSGNDEPLCGRHALENQDAAIALGEDSLFRWSMLRRPAKGKRHAIFWIQRPSVNTNRATRIRASAGEST